MQSANRIALKEWASVCAAVAQGRQSILLRKGGIDEGPGGFQVQHSEFWLYPTRFHQNAAELAPDAAGLLNDPAAAPPLPGVLQLSLYAVVRRVEHVTDEAGLLQFRGLHVLSDAAVQERFHYRRPGLFAIEIEAFRLGSPHQVPDLPEFAGCHSWVDLGIELPTAGLRPLTSSSCGPLDGG
jgi:hypothetical protein